MPCSWEEGLIEARERKLFISPPVGGWILVVGSSLPDPTEDVDECYRFLTSLSRKLGHVQFFSTNRFDNHHAWALIDQGRVFRLIADLDGQDLAGREHESLLVPPVDESRPLDQHLSGAKAPLR